MKGKAGGASQWGAQSDAGPHSTAPSGATPPAWTAATPTASISVHNTLVQSGPVVKTATGGPSQWEQDKAKAFFI